jgi:hypothetical protein
MQVSVEEAFTIEKHETEDLASNRDPIPDHLGSLKSRL